jgi:DNA invertase Pin-like site-specific DNA recombinase
VIGYVRVSTAEQVDGQGLDVQRSGLRDYCKAQGLVLVAILSDEGVSGSNGLVDRLGLAEALVRIERGDATALVVYRFDRLARDLVLQETIYARLESRGASVLSVSEPSTGDDATRTLIRQVMGSFAQYERTLIRGRMTAGKARKVAEGGYGGGSPRFGYTAHDGKLVPDPAEQAVVCRIREMESQGASLRAIALTLNTAGLRTKRGGSWQATQVARVLRRCA